MRPKESVEILGTLAQLQQVLMEYITLFIAKSPEIVAALFAVHAAAVAIVNLTPTPKDDEIVAKFYRLIEILAGIVSRTAKK